MVKCVNRVLYLIIMIVALQGCGSSPLKKGKRHYAQTALESSCIGLTNQLLKSQTETYLTKMKKKYITPMMTKISSYSTKHKFQFLNLLKSKSGRFKLQTEMYANTLNQMLNKKIIDRSEIPALISPNPKAKYVLDFSYQEVRVLEKQSDNLPTLNESMEYMLKNENMDIGQAIKLREILTDADLDPIDLKTFQESFTAVPTSLKEWEDVKNYLTYASTLRSKAKVKAIKEIDFLFKATGTSKNISKFNKLKSNIKNYNEKQYKKQFKKFSKQNISSSEAKKLAKVEADRLSAVYSDLKYACRSAKPTDTTKRAAKSTSGFFMGTGLAVTMGTYAYANWDRDKGEFEWFGKLGHDLIWKMIFQFGYNAIMTDPAASLLKKTLSLHIFYTPADAIEAAMYEVEFGEENSFIDEEYERLKQQLIDNDPEFAKNYNDVVSYLGKEYLGDKIKGFFKAVMSGEVELPKGEVDNILSAEDISLSDMDDEELKEKLLEAITTKMYDGNSGQIKLGSHFLDRYAFVRSYDVMDVPKSLLVGLWIYRTMCMGGNNMKLALIKASSIYIIDQLISKFIYYQVRRDLINM